jgi:hypothetical protein
MWAWTDRGENSSTIVATTGSSKVFLLVLLILVLMECVRNGFLQRQADYSAPQCQDKKLQKLR